MKFIHSSSEAVGIGKEVGKRVESENCQGLCVCWYGPGFIEVSEQLKCGLLAGSSTVGYLIDLYVPRVRGLSSRVPACECLWCPVCSEPILFCSNYLCITLN